MKHLLVGFVVLYTIVSSVAIWISTLYLGFMFCLTDSFGFMYNVVPFIGAVGLFFLIKHSLLLIGKIVSQG
jgi:hypothetical protein